ncbi:potassium transporter Kef [Litchfieldella qijiaojingensis]|uniref:Potassium transporter Kef n=1 Tax=Litchfieldella qijiaojingensis TaxID=980347 RepID=A0ABQ2YEA9_9GAMM|nr:cation:proton antiporter family protein [Halomonas qijiaojingensis]GGX80821.1 potassium transporter Kef [Halomonas qijiaojingensis]
MIEVVSLSFAFVFGVLVRQLGLPPLVGFLVAGFALNAYGPAMGLPSEAGYVLNHVAHLGILLLLFTVGLKLKLRNLVEPVVLGGALLHFVFTVAVFSLGLIFFLELERQTAVMLAIALSFSSTVLAAKVLESKRELRAFHGRVAIGILIVQDVVALAVLSIAGDHSPSWWAMLIFGLPFLKPALNRLMDVAGHEELLVLMGVVLAVAIGGMGFELVGLSPELGALLMGLLLSDHPRAQELSKSLWGLKEILLIGFFLQIGMTGLPDTDALIFALTLGVILPLKGLLFFFLLTLFRLRARNAFLGALSLTCYSEFGLIVASGVLSEWLVPLAITVAVSFIVAAPLNRLSHPLFDRFETFLVRFEKRTHHPDEQPASLDHADYLIMGMGRTGTAAFNFLAEHHLQVIGLDADPSKVARHQSEGRHVVYADAEDIGFWNSVDLSRIKAVILTLPEIEGKLIAARQLRKHGFTGPIVAQTMFDDESERLLEAGADETYLTMTGAGIGLAEKTWQAFHPDSKEGGTKP